MRYTKQECIERLSVFEDTRELSLKLEEMAEEADETGRYADGYYLKECSVHMDGLFNLARMLASYLTRPEKENP